MTTYVALLRGINVAGRRSVAMARLRDLATDLGFQGARTLLQSGNLVFQCRRRPDGTLERVLEQEAVSRLALEVDFLVRTADEWRALVERNPFPDEAKRDPRHLVVMSLKRAIGARDVRALEAAIRGPELVRGGGRQVYIVYPAGIGRSPLTNRVIETTLGTRGTARNWSTVLKVAGLVGETS